jgi:hypothetical protein
LRTPNSSSHAMTPTSTNGSPSTSPNTATGNTPTTRRANTTRLPTTLPATLKLAFYAAIIRCWHMLRSRSGIMRSSRERIELHSRTVGTITRLTAPRLATKRQDSATLISALAGSAAHGQTATTQRLSNRHSAICYPTLRKKRKT